VAAVSLRFGLSAPDPQAAPVCDGGEQPHERGAQPELLERLRAHSTSDLPHSLRPVPHDFLHRLHTSAQLPREDPSVRGVAAVDRLLASAATPLYGEDVEPLRNELWCARYLLSQG
jgi:hypothetical protein